MNTYLWALAIARAATLAGALAGLALIPASRFSSFDPIVNFAPVAAGVLLIWMIGMLVFQRDRIVIAGSLIALLGPLCVVAPEVIGALFLERGRAPGEPSLKVLSVNVWSGNRNYSPLLRLIEEEKPDVILAQETFYSWSAKLTASGQYSFAAGCILPHECNSAVLSKLKPSGPPLAYAPSMAVAHLLLPERLNGRAVEVASVHLSRPPPMSKQVIDAQKMSRVVGGFSDWAILGGDFNATPWTSVVRRLDNSLGMRRATRLLPSWPGSHPVAPIDHVYVGRAWTISDVRIGPDIGSDHRPVIVVLTPR